MKDFNLAKKICKEHGMKGFKKMRLARTVYIAGKQCQMLDKSLSINLVNKLLAAGFQIKGVETVRELAEKGLLDCLLIA